MSKIGKHCWSMIFAVALSVAAAWGQQKDPRINPPLAPYPALAVGESSSKTPEEGSAAATPEPKPMTPDTRPLAGVEEFTLGSLGASRSYLVPSFQFSQLVDTNSSSTSTQRRLDGVSLVRGSLDFNGVWSNYQLAAHYAGGGTLYNSQSQLNANFHQLGVTQTIAWRRWSLLLGDNFGHFPESYFSFQGYTGLGQFYGGLAGQVISNTANLNPLLVPSQTILTGRGGRISNTFVGQMDYQLTPRASITASGSYGIFRVLEAGFINSNSSNFQFGYNYAVTSRDTLAVIYGLHRLRFDPTDTGVNNQLFHLAYGRRVAGRLALQIAGGAQMNTFRRPLTGSGSQLSLSLRSALHYQFRNSGLGLSYLRGTTEGSGVLLGAQSHVIEMTANRQFSRRWSGSVDLGYARNSSLQQLTRGLTAGSFDTWRTGFQLSRPLGRSMSLFFAYFFNRQSGNTAPCAQVNCGASSARHQFELGFDWQFRPIEIH
jgi:hypothetical protein